MLDLSRKHDRATELRAIADGRLLLNVRNGVTVARSMLARIADEFEAMSTALAAKDAELTDALDRLDLIRIDRDRLAAQLAEARKALDEAIKAAGEQAILRGEAEGKLAASEMAGIVDGWKRRAEAAEARLAEALKALGMMLKEHDILSGNFGDVMDPKHKRPDRWPTAAEAARRVLEGGKSDE